MGGLTKWTGVGGLNATKYLRRWEPALTVDQPSSSCRLHRYEILLNVTLSFQFNHPTSIPAVPVASGDAADLRCFRSRKDAHVSSNPVQIVWSLGRSAKRWFHVRASTVTL